MNLQPIRRYGFDAAILFADILLLPQALGIADPQALLLLHDDFVHRQATALAGRLRKESGIGDTRPVKTESASSRAPDGKAPRESGTASTDAELIRAGYRLALQREPKEDEVAELSRYLAIAPADPDARSRQLALILLNLNEFAYVD